MKKKDYDYLTVNSTKKKNCAWDTDFDDVELRKLVLKKILEKDFQKGNYSINMFKIFTNNIIFPISLDFQCKVYRHLSIILTYFHFCH